MQPKLSVAMMYADFGNLSAEIQKLENSEFDSLHIDVMDGHYVPCFAMSLIDAKFIRANTDKPIEIHLMTENPGYTVDVFISTLKYGDTIYIHPDAERYPLATLEKISDSGLLTGLAVKPDMCVQSICDMLPVVDKVLLLEKLPTDEQTLPFNIDTVERKASQLMSAASENGIEIYCEGDIEQRKLSDMMSLGITGFVVEKMRDLS